MSPEAAIPAPGESNLSACGVPERMDSNEVPIGLICSHAPLGIRDHLVFRSRNNQQRDVSRLRNELCQLFSGVHSLVSGDEIATQIIETLMILRRNANSRLEKLDRSANTDTIGVNCSPRSVKRSHHVPGFGVFCSIFTISA